MTTRGEPSRRTSPSTAAALLRELGASELPVARLRVVLAQWLHANPPTPALVSSLRANGFGLLLAGMAASRPRPVVSHRLARSGR